MFGIGGSSHMVRASRSTDMYAFAILAWELLTGQLPFHDCYNESQLRHAFERNIRPDLTAISTSVFPSLNSASVPQAFRSIVEDLIGKCWDSDRLQRKSSLECLILLQSVYQMMSSKQYHIFISYSWKNQDFVVFIYYFLSKLGYYIWLDISSMGHSLQDSMKDGIANSAVILVFLSTGYLESENCVFELNEAYQQKKKVITVFLEPKEKFGCLLTKEIQARCSLDTCLYLDFIQLYEDFIAFYLKSLEFVSSEARSKDSYYDHFAKEKALQSFEMLFRILRNCGILPTVFRAIESENEAAAEEARPISQQKGRWELLLQCRQSENDLSKVESVKSLLPCSPTSVAPPRDPALPLKRLSRQIMFSYFWGYKKDHIMALEGKLKQLGYDIWREEIMDEEASLYDCMASAVESSSLIIIFVSNAYKSNLNCQRQALEIRKKSKPLLFVMLNENYHTSSSPEAVEGWLAVMIGDQVWYPLWNLDQLDSVSSAIANRMENTSLQWCQDKQAILKDHGGALLSERLLKAVVAPPPVPKLPRQHIMFSYAWFYKKDHVIALEGKLKQFGYDVWRDETGSSIVPSVDGEDSPYDCMTRAVENSSLTVMFICKAFFNSLNCCREAQYCRQGSKPMLFVMLDENYHTSSSPEAVEGWLGFMIGTQLWYPLWSLDQLESVSSAIANTIENISVDSSLQWGHQKVIPEDHGSELLSEKPVKSFVDPPPVPELPRSTSC
jgi:hypothetical protein